MRKYSAILASAILAITLLIACPVYSSQGRAISLKMLEKTLKDGTSDQAQTLCGVTRVSGFLVDPKTKDIILVGEVDPSYPTLLVDDFVVALRYANMVYARREGNVQYYSPPGCSIDPDPEVLGQLRQVGRGRGSSVEDLRVAADEWEEVGRQPQKVRVMGVPFDTHFAKVMVDADYYMKRLSNGSVDLKIPGFDSIMSMSIQKANDELESGVTSKEPEHSLSRFWFSPGESTYEENDSLVLLKECQVKLLTEDEFLTTQGEIKGLDRTSPNARKFIEGFTDNYQAIAEAKPVYKELESLFRFIAIAKLMKEKKALSGSGNQLPYLVSGYKVQNVPVNRRVTGLCRVVELTKENKTPRGTEIQHLSLMTCGGVSMDVQPKKVAKSVSRGSTKTHATLRKSVMASRKSNASLYWDFEVPD